MTDAADDSPPMPVLPVPVEPVPGEALPVDYELAGTRAGPPGLVRAIGVCSIVVASLGLVGGGMWTLMALVFMSFAQARASLTPVMNAHPALPGVAEVVATTGLPAAERAAAAEGLGRVRPLSSGQALQLDELLAESGHDLFSLGHPPDPAVAAAGVSGSGRLGGGGPTYFMLAGGRLELAEDRAVFFPAGANQPAVRAVAYDLPPVDPPPPLSDAAVRSTLRAIADKNGGRPKAAQVSGIITLLRSPAQQVVTPTTDGTDPADEVQSATTGDDGGLAIVTSHGGSAYTLDVTPAGQVSAALTPTAPSMTMGPPYRAGPMTVAVAASVAELGLAVYLLVVGIVTLRQARSGRWLHWVYVGLKLAVATAGLLAWAAADVSGSVTGQAAVGLVYPVVLMALLANPVVRAYYCTDRGG